MSCFLSVKFGGTFDFIFYQHTAFTNYQLPILARTKILILAIDTATTHVQELNTDQGSVSLCYINVKPPALRF